MNNSMPPFRNDPAAPVSANDPAAFLDDFRQQLSQLLQSEDNEDIVAVQLWLLRTLAARLLQVPETLDWILVRVFRPDGTDRVITIAEASDLGLVRWAADSPFAPMPGPRLGNASLVIMSDPDALETAVAEARRVVSELRSEPVLVLRSLMFSPSARLAASEGELRWSGPDADLRVWTVPGQPDRAHVSVYWKEALHRGKCAHRLLLDGTPVLLERPFGPDGYAVAIDKAFLDALRKGDVTATRLQLLVDDGGVE